jgi:hypothetical protein
VKLLPLIEGFLLELRYLLIEMEVKLHLLMEDFLIELRYLLIRKGNEAPPPQGGLPH